MDNTERRLLYVLELESTSMFIAYGRIIRYNDNSDAKQLCKCLKLRQSKSLMDLDESDEVLLHRHAS